MLYEADPAHTRDQLFIIHIARTRAYHDQPSIFSQTLALSNATPTTTSPVVPNKAQAENKFQSKQKQQQPRRRFLSLRSSGY